MNDAATKAAALRTRNEINLLYQRFGQFAVEFEMLTWVMAGSIAQLVQIGGREWPNFVSTLTVGQTATPLKQTLEALLRDGRTRSAEGTVLLDRSFADLASVITRRNDTVHRTWFFASGDQQNPYRAHATGVKRRRGSTGTLSHTREGTAAEFAHLARDCVRMELVLEKLVACVLRDEPEERGLEIREGEVRILPEAPPGAR